MDPCLNGGLCENSADFSSYTCYCHETEFQGVNCQTPKVDPCDTSACDLFGLYCEPTSDYNFVGLSYTDYLCKPSANSYCEPRTGQDCQDLIPCDVIDCNDRGTCSDDCPLGMCTVSDFVCTCDAGFTGNECETATQCMSENESFPVYVDVCLNGGTGRSKILVRLRNLVIFEVFGVNFLKNRFFGRTFYSKNLKKDQISKPATNFPTHCTNVRMASQNPGHGQNNGNQKQTNSTNPHHNAQHQNSNSKQLPQNSNFNFYQPSKIRTWHSSVIERIRHVQEIREPLREKFSGNCEGTGDFGKFRDTDRIISPNEFRIDDKALQSPLPHVDAITDVCVLHCSSSSGDGLGCKDYEGDKAPNAFVNQTNPTENFMVTATRDGFVSIWK